ncbi:deoxyribodipyrimidine photo-lyase [Sphingomonas sp.]|uniref:cryptochrome/photolyase family protein n=1 Tax=Sphingomonas sp. TaxID=28214 RepID=UPI0025D7D304|nr:deoxyribodipyrimidine photo-lyase [Sphingomonas sp.]
MASPSIFWFRQDLRLSDNPALLAAVAEGPVAAVYVLDDKAPGDHAIGGAQRWWLHHSLVALADSLKAKGVTLILRRGDSIAQLDALARETCAAKIFATRLYEPWWKALDEQLGEGLTLVDGNYLAPPSVLKTGSGGRYKIFTPYWRALSQLMPPPPPQDPPGRIEGVSARTDSLADWKLLPTTPDWSQGFSDWMPGEAGATSALQNFLGESADYDRARNMPSEEGTSRLSPHLHHGEISPTTVWHHVVKAEGDGEPFLREIGWRDYAANAIDQFPEYGTVNARPDFDGLNWRTGPDADADFTAWTQGRTGYPIVDAGMRQLWTTGWMHNRVRMIVASFLIKHLLIDWRRGERWFWDTLVDADYNSNSVNWQWVAGTGVDSNMFVRIMAPLVQSEKFDAERYIRRWVPELATLPDAVIHDPHSWGRAPPDYPVPLIGHREGRERALAAYRTMKT